MSKPQLFAGLLTVTVLLIATHSHSSSSSSPYLSPSTFHRDYQNMLRSFRIYTYTLPTTATDIINSSSSFTSLILSSPFHTRDPEEAHLFYIPFPDLPTRSLARAVKDLRASLPFWNRTLGADHFYLSASGLGFESDRNLVELKKNSIQICPFPAPAGRFIPHKDLTLPPHVPSFAPANANLSRGNLCYVISAPEENEAGCLEAPVDLAGGEFCVFRYGGDFTRLAHALGAGCVPVIVTERPMQDLPLMNVVRWEEIALFVGPGSGLREVMELTHKNGAAGRMKKLGLEASRHFAWNDPPQQYDAFYMVMYQLWLRRHTIRYTRREFQ